MSISIIIPVYNVAPYIRRCLESVMSQDAVEADVECILVDDCGQDNSMEIAREMMAEYQGSVHFHVVAHNNNLGLSVARNTGLEHATGDYVLFVDSDDYLLPDSLCYLLDGQRRYPDVDMIVGNVKDWNGNLVLHLDEDACLLNDPDVFFGKMLHHQIYLHAWNKLIRRSVLVEHNIRFIKGILFEDQSWSYMLFSHLSSVLLMSKETYFYTCNPASIINSVYTQKKVDMVIHSYTVSSNFLLDHRPDGSRYRRNMTVDYLLFIANYILNGVDLLLEHTASTTVAYDFLKVRRRLLFCALRNGRLLLTCFFLLLFWPFSMLQKLRIFRRQYYNIESGVNLLSHLTDFLHCK